MNALAIKKGASRHSAYDLRGPLDEHEETHTLAVLVDNEAGVLARVIGLFSGRGYNIDSLTVAETDHEGHLSRITIVTTGTPAVIEQIKAQLGRLVPVHDVHDLTVEGKAVQRELALIKVTGTGEKRVEAMRTRRRLPRPRRRHHARELRLRADRRAGEGRRLHRADAPARPRRRRPHRRRRHRARGLMQPPCDHLALTARQEVASRFPAGFQPPSSPDFSRRSKGMTAA